MNLFLEQIKNNVLINDGSLGFMLQKAGLSGGECPDLWNSTHPEKVTRIHSQYKDAGSDVIQTNTFQGNREILKKYSLEDRVYELNFEGAALAKEVMGKKGFVAASIGPIGRLFEPSGDLTFDDAYAIYKEQLAAVAEGGVDAINFETFTDLSELRVALIAAKENFNLPVICSLAFEENGRTLMGTDPRTAGIVLKSLGADIIGANCSFGPEKMIEIIKEMAKVGGIPLVVNPNAGTPEYKDGQAVYSETPSNFAKYAAEFISLGVRLIGGCCGTTPEFIKKIAAEVKKAEVPNIEKNNDHIVTSGVKTLSLHKNPINNLGSFYSVKKDDEVRMILLKKDSEAITEAALDLSSEGHDAIYINADSVGYYKDLLSEVVNIMQSYIKEPLIIETESEIALEKALRIYKGKAGVVINIGVQKNVEELISVAKKYGSTIIDKSLIDELLKGPKK